jgi:hypothetical protein
MTTVVKELGEEIPVQRPEGEEAQQANGKPLLFYFPCLFNLRHVCFTENPREKLIPKNLTHFLTS